MTAVLTRLFGMHNLALAEDVVQDAFCRALEVWKFRGVPENPSAWLMAAAKNRALDVLRRERTARTYAPELGRLLESEWTLAPVVEQLFSAQEIKDDELRMMFSCCHPRLAAEAQVVLILHILCGFSVGEIAGAFVSSHASIEKRITRAKKVLAGSKRLFEIAQQEDFAARLPAVQRALYLLFNEGYHGASAETSVAVADGEIVGNYSGCGTRFRLGDAERVAYAIGDVATSPGAHPLGATPATHALASLMHFDAARLPGRVDRSGNLSSLFEQDRAQWDAKLASEGHRLLDLSASGRNLSEYHLRAAQILSVLLGGARRDGAAKRKIRDRARAFCSGLGLGAKSHGAAVPRASRGGV